MSSHAAAQRPVGVFGGTYNPVHFGHLRSALEVVEKLDLQHLSLMPCAQPPLREAPDCTAEQRVAMVELAVADEPRLGCDARELRRAGKSYTIDSLMELRAEHGDQRSLCMVMGCDAVLDIPRWHRWQELLDWAHIVVIARPGWALPQQGEVAQWLERFRGDGARELRAAPAGSIIIEQLRPLPISSTEIRQLLVTGRSPRYLMPQSVLEFIEQHQLYRP